ncbi:MAG: hypothetical protein JSV30_03485 [Candidatus Omnitrophota bacterium]|nr:MAG: hypothetical protein JSV30_03485 [Candidatus Omnitrophota bacterium]
MLEALISSKVKRNILKKFLLNPDERYYIHQLAAILKASVGTIHRELIKFEKSGILASEKTANARFFYINQKNPLFKELRQIVFKTEGVRDRVESELNGVKGIRLVFVYGSFGREREDSDIDLFLIGSNIDENELRPKISKLKKDFNREINYTIYGTRQLKKEERIVTHLFWKH